MSFVFIDKTNFSNKTHRYESLIYKTDDINDFYKYYISHIIYSVSLETLEEQQLENDYCKFIIAINNLLDLSLENKWKEAYDLYQSLMQSDIDYSDFGLCIVDEIYLVEEKKIKFQKLPNKSIIKKIKQLNKKVIFQ